MDLDALTHSLLIEDFGHREGVPIPSKARDWQPEPSPRKTMKVCPAPMAVAFFLASSIMAGSVPDQRTRHLPDASQKASPNLMPGTAALLERASVL